MDLIRSLRIHQYTRMALVGSGGKTTVLRNIAQHAKHPILVTTTTHLGSWQFGFATHHITVTKRREIVEAEIAKLQGTILFTGKTGDDGRADGLDGDCLRRVYEIAESLKYPLIIEADGSRQKPIKAPADHEPVIPEFINDVVVCVGMSAIGMPITPEWVHRPERYCEVTGCDLGSQIVADTILKYLIHPAGGLKNIPVNSRRVVFLNQAATESLQAIGFSMKSDLLQHYDSVILACLATVDQSLRDETHKLGIQLSGEPGQEHDEIYAVFERIAGVVLAAGGSTRLGSPKQVLNWRGEPFVRHVVRAAKSAGLEPVVVITGAEAEQVDLALINTEVKISHNSSWQLGQSSSVKVGLKNLPKNCGAVIFLLADQPQISVNLIRALVAEHTKQLPTVVGPIIDGERGNPVLFDRDTFQELAELTGDTGGRAIFYKYPVIWIPWNDAQQKFDIDTLEDYHLFLKNIE